VIKVSSYEQEAIYQAFMRQHTPEVHLHRFSVKYTSRPMTNQNVQMLKLKEHCMATENFHHGGFEAKAIVDILFEYRLL